MSHEYFNRLWAEAQSDFRRLLSEEKTAASSPAARLPPAGPPGSSQALSALIELYYKYVSVLRKMDEVYDQMVHPQKRPLVRKILDLIIGRIIEIRWAMVGTEKSEFLYFDDYMNFYHWVPEELDLPIPKYYTHDRGPDWFEKEDWLKVMVKEKEKQLEVEIESENKAKKEAKLAAEREFYETGRGWMDDEEACQIIQTMERARQGRLRFQVAKVYYNQEERQKARRKLAKEAKMTPEKAAIIIQRFVRGFVCRRKAARYRLSEMEFLGFIQKPDKPGSERAAKKAEAQKWKEKADVAAEKRRTLQRRYQRAFEEAQVIIEARIKLLEAPEMAERMKYQLRKWMLYVKEKTGKLPDIPKKEHGGSRLIFCPDSLPEEVLEKAIEPKKGKKGGKNGKKGGGDGGKDKKKKKNEKKKGKKGGGDGKKKSGLADGVLDPPAGLEEMVKANLEYNTIWRGIDDRHNPDQRHDDEMIVKAKRIILGDEVRNQVDIMMKSELSLLKAALEKAKKKKGKKKKGKKGKGKKKKGKKKKKKRKGKDLTPDRTTQSLFEELVNNEIIKSYPKVHMTDLLGEYNLINGTLRRVHALEIPPRDPDYDMKYPGTVNPLPSMGDVKRAVKDLCVLPMGSKTVHEMAPLCKSLLIAGPEGSGKKSLVHAVCTEIGATFFDLTAANIAGKYPGKPGMNMLIHLLNKVGRLVSPSIIMIDNCDRTYMKRVPKTDKTEPKRLKKQLAKFLKGISKEDQIMVIGLSSEPWTAPVKVMKKDFPRVIYIPKPDYGSRLLMWRTKLYEQSEELHEDVNFSLLAKLSDGWTLGSIKQVTESVITKHQEQVKVDEEKRKRVGLVPLELIDHVESTGDKSGGKGEREKQIMLDILNKMMNSILSTGQKKIRMDDLLDEITLYDPLFVEQEKSWNTWWNKTALQKERLKGQVAGGPVTKKKGKGAKKSAPGAGKKKGTKKKKK